MAIMETVKKAGDAAELDELIWRILWHPLGFPRDIRSKFTIGSEKLELAAKEDGFRTAQGRTPEHPAFLEHGIIFELMVWIVEPGIQTDAELIFTV